MKILVTGTAGFIGHATAKALLERGDSVIGLDNINDYYDVNLKYGRLADTGIDRDSIIPGELVQSTKYKNYQFIKMGLQDSAGLRSLFEEQGFDSVCHLAAQAGVRYSLENPSAYTSSNISGFLNILEACRVFPVKHLVYASSSSVYGANASIPFSTDDRTDHPLSLYAATKKANELMAHTYAHLYGIANTGLRFFTVYGPWGRPDMAPFLFTKAAFDNKPIKVFNHGEMQRDFTYIDDIVQGVIRVLDKAPASPQPGSSTPDQPAPAALYNIGNSSPVHLMDFISAIETATGRSIQKQLLPMQPGDVPRTWADTKSLEDNFGYRPATNIQDGVNAFAQWYREFYKITD